MTLKQLHDLIKQHIPQVNHLETETDEVAEGQCTIWQQDDCTFIIEFANHTNESPALVTILQKISNKINWLHSEHKKITQTILETNHLSTQDAYLLYTAFFVENDQDIFCEFAVSSPNWHEQTAEFSLEADDTLIYHGLENE